MAKQRRYTITLYPATIERGFVVTKVEFLGDKTYPTCSVTADNLDRVIEAAEALAASYGKPCRASVRCHDKPKPRGFDQRTRDLYYNLGNSDDEQDKSISA